MLAVLRRLAADGVDVRAVTDVEVSLPVTVPPAWGHPVTHQTASCPQVSGLHERYRRAPKTVRIAALLDGSTPMTSCVICRDRVPDLPADTALAWATLSELGAGAAGLRRATGRAETADGLYGWWELATARQELDFWRDRPTTAGSAQEAWYDSLVGACADAIEQADGRLHDSEDDTRATTRFAAANLVSARRAGDVAGTLQSATAAGAAPGDAAGPYLDAHHAWHTHVATTGGTGGALRAAAAAGRTLPATVLHRADQEWRTRLGETVADALARPWQYAIVPVWQLLEPHNLAGALRATLFGRWQRPCGDPRVRLAVVPAAAAAWLAGHDRAGDTRVGGEEQASDGTGVAALAATLWADTHAGGDTPALRVALETARALRHTAPVTGLRGGARPAPSPA